MHYDFLTRGNRIDVNQFVTNVEAMYFQSKLKGEDLVYNVVMRPIQLWEAIANEKDMPTVIKSINGVVRHPHINKYIPLLRKALKLKKMPVLDDDEKRRAIWNQNIEIVPIGVKYDSFDEKGDELL